MSKDYEKEREKICDALHEAFGPSVKIERDPAHYVAKLVAEHIKVLMHFNHLIKDNEKDNLKAYDNPCRDNETRPLSSLKVEVTFDTKDMQALLKEVIDE